MGPGLARFIVPSFFTLILHISKLTLTKLRAMMDENILLKSIQNIIVNFILIFLYFQKLFSLQSMFCTVYWEPFVVVLHKLRLS